MDVHGKVQLAANHLLVLPCKLVGAVNALGVPVSPIQAVLKHCDGKGVGKSWGVKTTGVTICLISVVNIWLQLFNNVQSLRLTQIDR